MSLLNAACAQSGNRSKINTIQDEAPVTPTVSETKNEVDCWQGTVTSQNPSQQKPDASVSGALPSPASLYHRAFQLAEKYRLAPEEQKYGVAAVIDSGLSPDIFPGRIDHYFDVHLNQTTPRDIGSFHGSFTASIMAQEPVDPIPGITGDEFSGIVPFARLWGVASTFRAGSGVLFGPEYVRASLLKILEWKRLPENKDKVVVINTNNMFPTAMGTSHVADAVEQLTDAGVLIVSPVGNSGAQPYGVLDPAIHPRVIGAGVLRARRDGIHASPNSNHAPTADGPNPDLCALERYSYALQGDDVSRSSGSSGASAMIAGVALLILVLARREWKAGRLRKSPDQLVRDGDIKRILMETAMKEGIKVPEGKAHQIGAGAVNAIAAADVLISEFRCT